MTEAITGLTQAISTFGASVSILAESLATFSRALILYKAPTERGDWPDEFAVLNRYLRTGRLPQRLS